MTGTDAPADGPREKPRASRRPRVGRWLVLGVVAAGALAAYGILDRNEGDAKLADWTKAQAVPSVDLVSPKAPTEGQRLVLPANIEAFYTAPIHSQVSGYVRMWYHDIGARVQKGELLAKIDAPEIDQQQERAKGELEKAQADYKLALLTADRWKALRASQAVSQQTADEKEGDAQARKAQVAAAQANLDRIKALAAFEDIVAPFDGIITARRIDVGALVSSSNTSSAGLFDVAATKEMRVYVQVPQMQAAGMKRGMPVTLVLPQFPGRTFAGKVDTTSDAISAQSRALLVEALFDNKDGLLSPGAYAEAHFTLPLDPHLLTIPSASMIFRNHSPEVATVKGDTVTLKPVTIVLDTGTTIEISAGLEPDDRFVASPSDAIETGDKVQVERIDGKPIKEVPVKEVPIKEAPGKEAPAERHEAAR